MTYITKPHSYTDSVNLWAVNLITSERYALVDFGTGFLCRKTVQPGHADPQTGDFSSLNNRLHCSLPKATAVCSAMPSRPVTFGDRCCRATGLPGGMPSNRVHDWAIY